MANSELADVRPELIVLRTAAETNGDLAEVEASYPAGAPPSPVRRLPGHEVRFEVLEGRLEIELRTGRRTLRAGEALTVPAGIEHRIEVEPGGIGARFLWQIKPAPEGEDLMSHLFGTASAAH